MSEKLENRKRVATYRARNSEIPAFKSLKFLKDHGVDVSPFVAKAVEKYSSLLK